MDDAEVTRHAIALSLSAWSQLNTVAQDGSTSDADALQAYIQACPFVTSGDSPAMKAALQALQKVTFTQKQTSRSRPNAPSKNNINKTASTAPASKEAARVAMRITISAWSQLLVQSSSSTTVLDDFHTMKLYIQQCPFVGPISDARAAALEGLEHASLQQLETFVVPPALVDNQAGEDAESDSEESVADKNSQNARQQAALSKSSSIHSKSRRQKPVLPLRPILFLLRLVLLDLPMALLFASYLALLWVRRVDHLYLQPAMKAAVWSEDRAEEEITYYNRECDVRDMTTHNPNDLFIPVAPLDASSSSTTGNNAAAIQQAYEHQLRHGFSIFQSVLTESTMGDLRNYVVSRNRQLSEEESIFVIENDNRFSFGLGTEEPSVIRAVKELATHPRLAPALEKVLGKNPALIEMTAITSTYGAVDQWWHDDVVASASAMKYGRTFGPSYSIFVQLQDTTTAMGATAVCPGSHKCASGQMEVFCHEHGFQAVNTTSGYWKAGDALLMNMNSYHRGTAHVDPKAQDRVMLILTFVPKPEEKAESRQLSQGITFSLRWDMWGHTLYDLAQADERMTQPWATLRALGLYKEKDASWGIDYVSSATMRMANEDNGFRLDELDVFLERGGFSWLPQFLNGQISQDENWHDFLHDTVERCLEFFSYLNGFVVGLYIIVLVAVCVVSPDNFGVRRLGTTFGWSTLFYGIVYAAWIAANHHVDNSQWAKDIVAGRRYAGAFKEEATFAPNYKHLPSTLPHQKDVLIETRYASRQLDMYNDWTRDHPGSQLFQTLVREYATAYGSVRSELFEDATAGFIVGAVEFSQGRFLLQNRNEWLWLDRKDAIDFTRAELVVETHPLLKYMRQELRFLESDYKYGVHRGTVLSQKSLDALKHLKNTLLRNTPAGKAIFTSVEEKETGQQSEIKAVFYQIHPKLVISTGTKRPFSALKGQRRIVGLTDKPTEPKFGQWLKSGDPIEGTEVLETGDAHWYKGTLFKVTASGSYYNKYDDNSYSVVSRNLVRLYKPYFVGEELEVLLEDDNVDVGTISLDHDDGTYDIFLDDEEKLLQAVPSGDLRRIREGFMEQEREIRKNYA